jgi:hypothetical protein
MGKIRELLDAVDFEKSDDYKQGWRGAVCHINDFYKMVKRSDGEPIDIVISLEVSEEQILKKVEQLLKK